MTGSSQNQYTLFQQEFNGKQDDSWEGITRGIRNDLLSKEEVLKNNNTNKTTQQTEEILQQMEEGKKGMHKYTCTHS